MEDCCSAKSKDLDSLARSDQRRVLFIVFFVNAVMFVLEFGFGLVAHSTAMMADSVDMLGDAIVYALSLYALERGERWRAGAAITKGGLILLFGAGVLVETGLKVAQGVTPSSEIMLAVTTVALAANLGCLALLWRYRRGDVNMSSTFECSRNDVLSNVGVLIAAGLVAATATGWPDVVAGLVIATLFLRSAMRILHNAWPVWKGRGGVVELD